MGRAVPEPALPWPWGEGLLGGDRVRGFHKGPDSSWGN